MVNILTIVALLTELIHRCLILGMLHRGTDEYCGFIFSSIPNLYLSPSSGRQQLVLLVRPKPSAFTASTQWFGWKTRVTGCAKYEANGLESTRIAKHSHHGDMAIQGSVIALEFYAYLRNITHII